MRILYALTFLCMKLYILNKQWSENFVIFSIYIYIYILCKYHFVNVIGFSICLLLWADLGGSMWPYQGLSSTSSGLWKYNPRNKLKA